MGRVIQFLRCFILGHSWGIANEYHSPIFYRKCNLCKKERYFERK